MLVPSPPLHIYSQTSTSTPSQPTCVRKAHHNGYQAPVQAEFLSLRHLLLDLTPERKVFSQLDQTCQFPLDLIAPQLTCHMTPAVTMLGWGRDRGTAVSMTSELTPLL